MVTDLKQVDALSPMLFNLVLEHIIRKVLFISGIELNSQHMVMEYAADRPLLGQQRRCGEAR